MTPLSPAPPPRSSQRIFPRRFGLRSADWTQRISRLNKLMSSCRLCPHVCAALRQQGERGRCRVGDSALLAEACVHHGEEPVFGGGGGTGNLFLSGCQLRCVFCQNHQISQSLRGQRRHAEGRLALQLKDSELAQEHAWRRSPAQLAQEMLRLQALGVGHIGWVSPSPQLPWLVKALQMADQQGLNRPLIYNSGGYERLEVVQLLDSLIDIYLPDFKYVSPKISGRLSAAPDYAEQASLALQEMARQIHALEPHTQELLGLTRQGSLWIDAQGQAQRGLLIRHLVLPGHVAESLKVLDHLVSIVGEDFSLSLMAQYQPMHRAAQIGGPLARTLRRSEYQRVLNHAEALGISQIIGQELSAGDHYVPDFSRQGAVFDDEKM